MSLAENLLNSLPTENAIEDYSDNEEEEYIVIDNTRKITVPTKLKTIAVTGDKDVETVTFRCVRYWDEHDLSAFDIYINYILPNGESGTYIPQTKGVYDYYFEFQWIIGWEITRYKGGLSFLITALENSNDGTLSYQWSSLMNNDCTIAQGIIISDTPDPLEKAFEEGRKAEYDAFWDAYQNNGAIYSANDMFAGASWNDVTFNPKHSMSVMKRADYMFKSSGSLDLKGILERNRISFDFGNTCTDFQNMFYYSAVYNIPEIDCSLATSMRCMFDNAQSLRNIDKIILPKAEPYSGAYEYMFNNCKSLETVSFSGDITQSVDFHWSTKLSKASIESIIYALDEKGSGRSITLSKTAVDVAFYDSNKDHDGSDSAEWEELISERDNWTINLV